jgi:hypothetical protein
MTVHGSSVNVQTTYQCLTAQHVPTDLVRAGYPRVKFVVPKRMVGANHLPVVIVASSTRWRVLHARRLH